MSRHSAIASHELEPRRPFPREPLQERSALASKRRVGVAPAIVASLLAHALVFGGALVYARYTPPRVVPEKPIVAKLVRLGKPRDEKLLPRLPSAPPPPPPKAASAPAAPPPAAPQPPPKAPEPARTVALPKDPPTPSASPKAPESPPAKATAPQKTPEQEALERQKRLADALARLGPAPTGATTAKAEELPGQEDGDPEGTADDAAEGDRYLALIEQALRRNYTLPTTITQRERMFLNCKLLLKIARNGKIDDFRIEESSGNDQFDRAIEASVLRTGMLPPPPPSFLKDYGDGIVITFRP